MKETIEECFALDLADGEFPPGVWVSAGRFDGEYGVFCGDPDGVRNFIPEPQIAEVIADLRRHGEDLQAQMLADIEPDVAALRAGRQRLVRDLAGKRLPVCGTRKEKHK